jgi:hypothetical protein
MLDVHPSWPLAVFTFTRAPSSPSSDTGSPYLTCPHPTDTPASDLVQIKVVLTRLAPRSNSLATGERNGRAKQRPYVKRPYVGQGAPFPVVIGWSGGFARSGYGEDEAKNVGLGEYRWLMLLDGYVGASCHMWNRPLTLLQSSAHVLGQVRSLPQLVLVAQRSRGPDLERAGHSGEECSHF